MSTTITSIQQLADGNAAGTQLGRSDDLIGRYGATPVAQRAFVAQVATSVVTTATTTTSPWGFATSTQADNLCALVADIRTKLNSIQTDMINLGDRAAS